MNKFETNEIIIEEFPTKDIITSMYNQHDIDDPRSHQYERAHIVPKINWISSAVNLIFSLIMFTLLLRVTLYLLNIINIKYSYQLAWIISAFIFLIYIILNMKKLLIWMIKL